MHRCTKDSDLASGWYVDDMDIEIGSSPEAGVSRLHRHASRSQRPPIKPPVSRRPQQRLPTVIEQPVQREVAVRRREAALLEMAIEGLLFGSDDEDYHSAKEDLSPDKSAEIASSSPAASTKAASENTDDESKLSSSFSEWVNI